MTEKNNNKKEINGLNISKFVEKYKPIDPRILANTKHRKQKENCMKTSYNKIA